MHYAYSFDEYAKGLPGAAERPISRPTKVICRWTQFAYQKGHARYLTKPLESNLSRYSRSSIVNRECLGRLQLLPSMLPSYCILLYLKCLIGKPQLEKIWSSYVELYGELWRQIWSWN